MNIIVIITTKNRCALFSKAAKSVFHQARQATHVFVVSDSNEDSFCQEQEICQQYHFNLLRNQYAHNYAGSLNTAVHWIINNSLEKPLDFGKTYIALLDDDDYWDINYLKKCEEAIHGEEDFVVCGLTYCTEEGEKKLSIPQTLSINDFLRGNPHLQGSNTFIKFSTLLKAGLFDENMSSTTDRDIFTRTMMLCPTYAIVNEYLVYINAFNDRERITNGVEKKTEGLRKFYYKYQSFMTSPVREDFFCRAETLFHIQRRDITKIEKNKIHNSHKRAFSTVPYKGELIIGCIATEYALGLRLLKQLIALKRASTHIVIFINFTNDIAEYERLLRDSCYQYTLLQKDKIANEIINANIIPSNEKQELKIPIIKDIAVSRSILQYYLYKLSSDTAVIWILDEDMELKEIVWANDEFVKQSMPPIDNIIATYRNEYDAVIGNYTLDAPLPTLSTIRTSLLDFFYTAQGLQGNPIIPNNNEDYYYDLTDCGNLHLETPIRVQESANLHDVFSGKAISRPLFQQGNEMREVKSRGGNTLIFNRKLLTIPNWSLKVGDIIGRRSDYFWVLQAKAKGYRLANAPFATLHNRSKRAFNYEQETKKLLKDLVGSSFTKAVETTGLQATSTVFYESFVCHFKNRLTKYIASFYRIMGLLSCLKTTEYSVFNQVNLQFFVKNTMDTIEFASVTSAYEELVRALHMQKEMDNKAQIERIIAEQFNISTSLNFLGNGGEGAVFSDGSHVYKYFFKSLKNVSYLQNIAALFSQCDQLYPIEIFEGDNQTIIRYPYEKGLPYNGGYAADFASFIAFTRKNGFVFNNFKKENFIIVDGRVKLIDYGKSLVPCTEKEYIKSIKRAYEMIRYSFLSESEFKRLVKVSYQVKADKIDFGWTNFQKLVNRRYKEQLHDDKVLQFIQDITPQTVLDYGAGKCKIANSIADSYAVDVFDIDLETLQSRAAKNVRKFTCANSIPTNYYNLILNNLVLCCVDNDIAASIVNDIANCLKVGGTAIFSICNPFFNNVQHTELRKTGLSGNYYTAEKFEKRTTVASPLREEYHRPIEYYVNLLQKFGFFIEDIAEGDGVNVDTLQPIAEHLILKCKLLQKPTLLSDCSLLIKTNPMEYREIYKQVEHIVCSLEKGIRFFERVVTVDLTNVEKRARKYDEDDECLLIYALERAKQNGLIDRIVVARQNELEIKELYKKYFDVSSPNGHCLNGQGLFATLLGFEKIHTPFVFQTDSDILYCVNNYVSFLDMFADMKRRCAITATMGICNIQSQSPLFGTRTEVRTCFLDLKQVNSLLPLKNSLTDETIFLPWHRALDCVLSTSKSIRFCDKNLYFVHPENIVKQQENFLCLCRSNIERGHSIVKQVGAVNLTENRATWVTSTNAEVVLYIRGYNVGCEKIKRMFDSVAGQTYQNFIVVYVDDASTNGSAEYAKFILDNDNRFKDKSIYLFNDKNVGELQNFVFVMQNVIVNPQAIVINLDNDDCFIETTALERILREFASGAEITCGNCVRYDKPLKRYKVYSFDKVWERDGDNIWLHPKCFRRYLFDCIEIESDLKLDGEFVKVNTDFAIMLPMLANANRKSFIEDEIYYFEPSIENINKSGVYASENKDKIKKMLLDKAKKKFYLREKDV